MLLKSNLYRYVTAPRVDPMWDRLRTEPHVYAGPEHEKELDAAWADAQDENDCGEEGTPDAPPRGFTLDELIDSTQASAGLHSLPGVRLVTCTILGVITCTILGHMHYTWCHHMYYTWCHPCTILGHMHCTILGVLTAK